MPTNEQLDKLTRIIEDLFCVTSVSLSWQSTLRDFNADDLDCVEFCMAIEEEFGVELDSDDLFGDYEKWLDKPIFEFINAHNSPISP